jgi:hypothetical protein
LIERNLNRLQVPSPTQGRKEQLIQKLQEPAEISFDFSPATPNPAKRSHRGSWAALAASVAIVGGIWLFSTRPQAVASLPNDPLLDSVIQCNVTLAAANSTNPEKKLESLAEMARQLASQMNSIAKVDPSGKNLVALARLYTKVVQNGLLEQAPELNEGDKVRLLKKLKDELTQTSNEALELSAEVPPSAIASFKQLSSTAKMGAERISRILAGQS